MLRNILQWRNIAYNSMTIIRKLSQSIVGLEGRENFEMDGTMHEIRQKLREKQGIDEAYTVIPKSRENLLAYHPKIENLNPRSMQDSFTSAIIPLKEDKNLQERYIASRGHVRYGRLLEDMDLFAVWVCSKHVNIPNLPKDVPLPYTFVTVLVDKVGFTEFVPSANEDIRVTGHVSWVGKTSMEIVVWLEQMHNGKYHKITRAFFLMAARNATNTGGAPINPLKPENKEEEKIISSGQQRRKRRQAMDSSFLGSQPDPIEQTIMHNLFKRTTPPQTLELNVRVLPENSLWMTDCSVSSTSVSFPENRNHHNKIFGGFIMRNAFEVSWIAAYQFIHERPHIEQISDISFQKPVDISSFMKMTAHVTFTEANYLQVMAVVNVIDPNDGTTSTSNKIYSTFRSQKQVSEILPRSYHETMWYLEGRRKYKKALDLV